MLGVSLVLLNALLVLLNALLVLLNALVLLVLLNVLVLLNAPLLYYQFAALAVALENTSQGSSLDSVADDFVASDIGKYQFLVWAAFSHLVELVQDGCPRSFDHLG